jgi:inorganic pyrophosphatase
LWNPRASRVKFAYDPKLEASPAQQVIADGAYLSPRLGVRTVYQSRRRRPLDIMVIHEAATFPGLVVTCRVIGVLQIEQKSKKKSERHDRLFAVPRNSHSEQALHTLTI